jgi:predicted unusual protein kinase regulating ubiquinone biosynthesis (AarF/ABC1/UbiB family)
LQVGVISGLRQLLEFGLFHGDPHPGNIFAMQVNASSVILKKLVDRAHGPNSGY